MNATTFWNDLTATQKADLIKSILALYEAVREKEGDDWNSAKAESTLNIVEAVIFVAAMGFAGALGGPMASGLLGAARTIQKYWMESEPRERSAEHVHAWLEKRNVNETVKKIAFSLFLWQTGTDVSDAFGKAIDNWNTPFSAWLSLYGWAYLESDIGGAVSPVPEIWAGSVLTGPVLGAPTAPIPDQWGVTSPPTPSKPAQNVGWLALVSLLAVPYLLK